MKNAKYYFFTALLLCCSTMLLASPITRMDVYDASDNHLLYVIFDYSGSGACTGRSVYTSDSTLLYHTTFSGAGTATTENSVDYLNNPLYTTTINTSTSGTTDITTVDQFGLSQFGAPLSSVRAEPNTYNITQSNTLLCKQTYEYDSTGELSKILMVDKNSETLWYAQIAHQSVGVLKSGTRRAFSTLRVSANRGAIKVHCGMVTERFVSAELITPLGRRVISLINKKLPAGEYHFAIQRGNLPASGTYIARVTMDGTSVLTQKIVVQK